MTKPYKPKVNDIVFLQNRVNVQYAVIGVNSKDHTADIKSITGQIAIHRDVSWLQLTPSGERLPS